MGPNIMAFSTDDWEFILDINASNGTNGVVLIQFQIGVERVIIFDSQILGKSKWNYCVTNGELLAVKYFMEYYKHYLWGQHFRVCSDHEAMKWLFSLKESKHRVARLIRSLSEYDFKVEY